MGEFSKWLLHDDQKELFDVLAATVMNILFLGLAALLLWPLGKAALALALAKGYWVFWSAMFVTAALLVMFQRMFRVDMDSHFDAYVISGFAVSGLLQAGWSAFAALAVRSFAAGSPVWVAAPLYFVGLLSCWIAYNIVAAYYGGIIYRRVNLPLAAISFLVFSLWPAAARTLYGWFFDFASTAYGRFFDLF